MDFNRNIGFGILAVAIIIAVIVVPPYFNKPKPDVKFTDNSAVIQDISKGDQKKILVNVKNNENKTIDNISIKTMFNHPDANYLVIQNPEIPMNSMGNHEISDDQYVYFLAKNETSSGMKFDGVIGIYVNGVNTDNKTITWNLLP